MPVDGQCVLCAQVHRRTKHAGARADYAVVFKLIQFRQLVAEPVKFIIEGILGVIVDIERDCLTSLGSLFLYSKWQKNKAFILKFSAKAFVIP